MVDAWRQTGNEVPLYNIQFNQDKSLDHRTYNVPVAQTEVAGIFVGEPSKYDRERTLTVMHRFQPNRENFSTVNCTCAQADPLCYPLLFPRGDLGYYHDMDPWHGPPPAPEGGRLRQANRSRNRFLDDSSSDSDSASEDDGEYGQARRGRPRKPKQWKPAKKISMLDFMAYRMHWRKEGVHPNNHFSPQFWARRLFQQLAVDSFSRVEENDLNYLRTDEAQTKLRSEAYHRLQEYVNQNAQNRNLKPGKPVVLPSTFPGSARHMAQEYMDAMAIKRKKGSLDYFITMTTNPKWNEIVSSLPRDANGTLLQTATDRPDLVARVFKMKLDELLKDLFERKVFGEVAGYAWTIEYQKRGLPHVHILLILQDDEDKPRTSEHVDRVVSCLIPDKAVDPELHKLVAEHMIHGPCGDLNPHCPCMNHPKNPGKCAKGFPFPHCDHTIVDSDGYPVYKRPFHGPVIEQLRRNKKTFRNITSEWVVPYNAYLLRKFQCHCNVQLACSIKSIKYIYKYIYKGQDKCEAALTENNCFPLSLPLNGNIMIRL